MLKRKELSCSQKVSNDSRFGTEEEMSNPRIDTFDRS